LKLTEYRSEEVLQRSWFDTFLVPSQNQAAVAHFRQSLAQNSHNHYQNSILTKSGKECIFAWNNTILRDNAGQPIGKVSIGEDITERYKVERMKAEFISVVSHELRTPLTSMQAALSLLSEKIIDPTSTEGEATIQIATEGTDRLVRLVNDILVLERLESGKVRLEKRPWNVYELLNTAIVQMEEMAKQEGVTLLASPCTISVDADGDQLLQVLTNLLSNAIKFSPSGSTVWLAATASDQKNQDWQVGGAREGKFAISSPYLLFTIKDQGRGIPADSLERIFDRFHQVDASDSREKGGTGLGLAICRSIVHQHGGEIWAESIGSQGSTFYFTIPMSGKQNGKPNK
jgi:PAS domain S-box-containing protein